MPGACGIEFGVYLVQRSRVRVEAAELIGQGLTSLVFLTHDLAATETLPHQMNPALAVEGRCDLVSRWLGWSGAL